MALAIDHTTESSFTTTENTSLDFDFDLGNLTDLIHDLEDVFGDLEDLLTAVEICSVIWKIGLAFTALGLIMITATWALFPKWRHYKNYISWNQCFSTIAMSWAQAAVCIGILPTFMEDLDNTETEEKAMEIIFIVADYFELASMCWTVAAAVLCYAQVVLVFDRSCSHKYTKVTALCWGGAFVIKLILVLIDKYVDTEDDPAINYEIIPVVPVAIMALANVYCYVRVIICIYNRTHDQRKKLKEATRTITTGIFLLFIFGFTFVLHFVGVFVQGSKNFSTFIIYLYALSVISSLHGGVLAFAFVFAIRSTRNLWIGRFFSKKREDHSTNSTRTTMEETNEARAPLQRPSSRPSTNAPSHV